MFWSGNFVTVKELKSILKEEYVTLTQVLEADDILMECKADNPELIQYLTRPDVLAELITLITTEPPKEQELQTQYRYACIACEVLSSHVATLSDRLSADAVQMNRLCDFVSTEADLNPLLASFFSKTFEMLLQRSSKQDWCLYHIVCLRVVERLRARPEFLPSLLRHLATSAIVDTFKFILKADDIVYKPIIEWLEEHEFVESLIKVICGTYGCEPEPIVVNNINLRPPAATNGETAAPEVEISAAEAERRRRISGTASDNAAALLCDIIYEFIDIQKSSQERPGKVSWWAVRSAGEAASSLLSAVFSSPAQNRDKALVNGGRVLRALLSAQHHLGVSSPVTGVELALAPHLPLLHQALLTAHPKGVGAARVELAAVSAALAAAHHPAVPVMLCTLGTIPVLFDLMLQYPHCSVLHGFVRDAFVNAVAEHNPHKSLYTAHLSEECDLLTKILDTFDKNGGKQGSATRGGYMGHLVAVAGALGEELVDSSLLSPELETRWRNFRDHVLGPLLMTQFSPLGGYHPPDSYKYSESAGEDAEFEYREEDDDADIENCMNERETRLESDVPEDDWLGPPNKKVPAFSDTECTMDWDKAPEDDGGLKFPDEDWAPNMSSEFPDGRSEFPAGPSEFPASPSEFPAGPSEFPAGPSENLFAREEDFAAAFADKAPADDAWACQPGHSREQKVVALANDLGGLKLDEAGSAALANNLLTAMSGMSADVIANIVNANHEPTPPPNHPQPPPNHPQPPPTPPTNHPPTPPATPPTPPATPPTPPTPLTPPTPTTPHQDQPEQHR